MNRLVNRLRTAPLPLPHPAFLARIEDVATAGFMHGGVNRQFSYSCLSGSNLLHTLTQPNGITLTQSYEEHRDLLTGMQYHRGSTLVAERSYSEDKAPDGCKGDWTNAQHLPEGRGAVRRLRVNICEVFGSDGYIKTAYTYTPYGSVTANGNVTQPIQWSSEYNDTELGLVYYNYRHYNPADGRWAGRDTEDKIENAYKFVSNFVSLYNDYLGNYKIASEEITPEKRDIAWAIGWYDAMSIKDTGRQAFHCADEVSGYTGSWGGENDAIRHCTWVCAMAQIIGYDQALEVADIHESYSPPTPPKGCRGVEGFETLEGWAKEDTAMDKHNNQIGAGLGANDCDLDCCQACIAKMNAKALRVNASGGYRFYR